MPWPRSTGSDRGEVLVLKRSDFEDLIHEDTVLCRAAWHSAASCMAHLSGLVAQLSFNKVSERVVLALLEDTEKDGDLVRLTQSDLAAEVGTTREVVARCLAGLQADGLIRLGRARITVLEPGGLQAQPVERGRRTSRRALSDPTHARACLVRIADADSRDSGSSCYSRVV